MVVSPGFVGLRKAIARAHLDRHRDAAISIECQTVCVRVAIRAVDGDGILSGIPTAGRENEIVGKLVTGSGAALPISRGIPGVGRPIARPGIGGGVSRQGSRKNDGQSGDCGCDLVEFYGEELSDGPGCRGGLPKKSEQ